MDDIVKIGRTHMQDANTHYARNRNGRATRACWRTILSASTTRSREFSASLSAAPQSAPGSTQRQDSRKRRLPR